MRVGPDEARRPRDWLREHLGEPPEVAVVLGSGLAPEPARPSMVEVPYRDIPHWRSGDVAGHPHVLSVVDWMGWTGGAAEGRAHEYEGFDVSEVQLPVRISGEVGRTQPRAHVGERSGRGGAARRGGGRGGSRCSSCKRLPEPPDGGVGPLKTSLPTRESRLCARWSTPRCPGPQYETPAELRPAAALGAGTVSMSPGGRAARGPRGGHGGGRACGGRERG